MRNILIISAIIFLIYSLFIEFGPQPVQIITQSQWQDNQYAIEKYFRDSRAGTNQHGIVYVGSSLTNRLEFNEYSKCVYNLSFGGDSALTGLSAIALSDEVHRLVFIEINVPERGINQSLINKASGLLKNLSPIFYIENMPINRVLSLLHRSRKDKSANDVNEAVLQNALALELQKYQALIPTDILKHTMTEFARLVREIEAKGSRIVLFEMPVHPDLEFTPRAVQVRNIFKRSFPNHKFLNFQDITKGGTIKTVDGEHLSSSEAKNVVENMALYFNDGCVIDLSYYPK